MTEIVNALLLALVLAACWFSFKAGTHKAKADMFGIMEDALRGLDETSTASELAKRIRQLCEDRHV